MFGHTKSNYKTGGAAHFTQLKNKKEVIAEREVKEGHDVFEFNSEQAQYVDLDAELAAVVSSLSLTNVTLADNFKYCVLNSPSHSALEIRRRRMTDSEDVEYTQQLVCGGGAMQVREGFNRLDAFAFGRPAAGVTTGKAAVYIFVYLVFDMTAIALLG